MGAVQLSANIKAKLLHFNNIFMRCEKYEKNPILGPFSISHAV